jgi:hypothetical protein
MKTKNDKHISIHQHIERILRHKVSLGIVTFVMLTTVASFDGRLRTLMQEMYAQGWGWVGTYMHHEHPLHFHGNLARPRPTTTSGASQ